MVAIFAGNCCVSVLPLRYSSNQKPPVWSCPRIATYSNFRNSSFLRSPSLSTAKCSTLSVAVTFSMEATNSLTRSPVPTINWLTGQDTLRSNDSPSSFHSAGRQFFTDALEGTGNFSCIVSGAGAVAEAGISIVAAGGSAGDATVPALGIAIAASALGAVAAVLLFG